MNKENENQEKLRHLLDNVSDSYEGFTISGLAFCRNIPNGYQQLIKFIENNPNVTSSEIVEFVSDLRGIKKVNKVQTNETEL